MPATASRTRSNAFDGKCTACKGHVPAHTGTLTGSTGRWCTWHNDCLATIRGGGTVEVDASPRPTGRPNRFDADCMACHEAVPAQAGELVDVAGEWHVRHDTCPPVVVPKTATAAQDAVAGHVESEKAMAALGFNGPVKPGCYAPIIDGEPLPVKIDMPTEGRWAGWTFVKARIARGDWRRVRGASQVDAVLAAIAAEPDAAFIRFGHVTGDCGHCGIELENAVSTTLGYGPTCAKHRALPYSKAAALALATTDEQREAILAAK